MYTFVKKDIYKIIQSMLTMLSQNLLILSTLKLKTKIIVPYNNVKTCILTVL